MHQNGLNMVNPLLLKVTIACQAIVAIHALYWGIFTFIVWGQDILTPKRPIASLIEAQTIYLQTQVVKGETQIDPQPLLDLITQRFRQVGYEVVTSLQAPHDVTVYFQCEEPVPPKRPANSTEKYVHHISGPPCLFHYAFHEKPVNWQRIDIIIYNEGIRATESLHQLTTASPSMAQSAPLSSQYLRVLDFPILLSAEWGQVPRLVVLLELSQTSLQRQKKIISLLGEIQAKQALPRLLDLLNDSHLQLDAAWALGNFGAQAQEPLITLLQTHPDEKMQAAAAQSLGRIGAATGDTRLTPLYIELLRKPGLDIQVKTEIVWAIGKSPDFRAHSTLEALENEIWNIRSNKPELQKLRKAVDWSIREVRQGGHTGDYS